MRQRRKRCARGCAPLAENLFIVDAHVHIWAADTPERRWPARHVPPHRASPFTQADLEREMRLAGVQRAVIVPPTWEGYRNDVGLAAARAYPERFCVAGRLDVEERGAQEMLRTWRAQSGMRAIRLHFALPDLAPLLTEGRANWIWKAAEAAGIPIMLLPLPAHLPHIGEIAEGHPGLQLALDHLALHLGKKDEEAFADLDALIALARYPNIAAKVSCLPLYTTDRYPFRNIHPYIRRVYDAFGPRRMFWGTDLTRLNCSYSEAVALFTHELQWLSPEDKVWIMGRAVCDWLRWERPQG